MKKAHTIKIHAFNDKQKILTTFYKVTLLNSPQKVLNVLLTSNPFLQLHLLPLQGL